MDEPGIATGLAWTSVGGEILFIEATRMHGKGKLQLTGQLGEVMKESAQAALSFVRVARQAAARPGGLPREQRHPHSHPDRRRPQGRPERGRDDDDGARIAADRHARPSRRRDDRRDHPARQGARRSAAIKEKVLAAHRAGIKRVILPERCVADLDEVPQEVRDDLEFVPVTKMDEVLMAALEEPEKLDLKPVRCPRTLAPGRRRRSKTRDRVAGNPFRRRNGCTFSSARAPLHSGAVLVSELPRAPCLFVSRVDSANWWNSF